MIEWMLGLRRPGGVQVVRAGDDPAGATVSVGGVGFAEGEGEFWIEVTAGDRDLMLDHLVIDFTAEYRLGDLAWLNGYQSWSRSEVRPLGRTRRPLNRIARWVKLDRYGDGRIARAQRDRWAEASHEVLAVQRGEGDARLWGSRVGVDAFTVFEVAPHGLRAVVDVAGWRVAAGETARVAWLEARRGASAPALLREWASGLVTRLPAEPVTGWTSWYRYYGDIDAARLRAEVEATAGSGIRFDVFQIDDGWQAKVGDWLAFAPGFPEGVAPLAEAARARGMLPGLWFAPFVASKHSALVRDHPGWLLRDARGRRVAAGWSPGWKGDYFVLDLEHPEVRAYLAEVFRTARDDWGFGLFKLDFLYAAALDGRPGLTRAQRMRRAMELLREWCGDAAILGCGVPLVSAAGLVEYCRIGSDVVEKWEDRLLRAVHYPERVSTVNSVRSTLARAWMDGTWFLNDPDVVILRTTESKLTDAERRVLFAVNRAFGSLVFVSDDVRTYDAETAALLKTWDPPGAARIIRQTREGDVDRVETDRGVFAFRLGDATGSVVDTGRDAVEESPSSR